MSTILDKILATKVREVEMAKQQRPAAELRRMLADASPARDFAGALLNGPGRVRLIAEVKKASPSAGLIRPDFDPVEIAKVYESSGAACISVLTDKDYFQGDLEYLRSIRAEVAIPVLRKDFIIDEYQLLEARAAGADCVLLIAECLSATQLKELHDQALALGLQTLIELYDRENVPAVVSTGGRIIGVNNRDLRSFQTNLQHTIALRADIPDDRILVGESGIREPADVEQLAAAGVQAMLVGESLMRQADLGAAVRRLLQLTV